MTKASQCSVDSPTDATGLPSPDDDARMSQSINTSANHASIRINHAVLNITFAMELLA